MGKSKPRIPRGQVTEQGRPEIEFRDWRQYRAWILDYAELPWRRREKIVFRGQADSRWGLQPTLDRHRLFDNDASRNQYYQELLDQFHLESLAIGPFSEVDRDAEGFELLARHQGLPTPWLDWTQSPFIASFFAFHEATSRNSTQVAIWMLDLDILETNPPRDVLIIDDLETFRDNGRALRQRGIFLRISTIKQTTIELLGESLTKLILPVSSRAFALAELDEMRINATGLFGDLESAAKTAVYRLSSN